MRHNINISALSASAAPRALSGLLAVQAMASRPEKTGNAMVDEVINAMEEFKAKHDARYTQIESWLDQMNVQMTANQLNGGGLSPMAAADPKYSAAFADFTRFGRGEADIAAAMTVGERGQIMAAMSSGSDSDGGYLAPTEWDRKIGAAQRVISPLRRICMVQSTSVGKFSTTWSDEAVGSGWVGETAARPATTTPQLSKITFGHGEIYANPAVTQTLLDDALFDVENWLQVKIANEFDKQESVAFLSGNGLNKPFGLMGYIAGGAHASQHPGGAIAVNVSGHATEITINGLIDFVYALPAPYRQNARWLFNSNTAAALTKMKDGDGNLIWRESLVAGQPARLLGYPVEIEEGMPSIAAGTMPIMFGDFAAGYVINDRIGIRVLRDPYTNKPYVHFYVTKRVGGGLLDPNALRAMKIAAE